VDDAPLSALWMPGHAAEVVDRIEEQLASAHLTGPDAAVPDRCVDPDAGVEPPD